MTGLPPMEAVRSVMLSRLNSESTQLTASMIGHTDLMILFPSILSEILTEKPASLYPVISIEIP